jgi:hypothetical protein
MYGQQQMNFGYAKNQMTPQIMDENVVGRPGDDGNQVVNQELIRTKVRTQFYPFLNE